MRIFPTKKKLKAHLGIISSKNHTVGMVPTMGALHQGHLALVSRAASENGVVVVSIFVNPTQFNNAADLKKYPKTLENDKKLLRNIAGEIIIFTPTITEIYSTEVISKKYDFNGLDKVMEGEFRKGHFDGVGTIVEQLLTIVKPDKAYFGEKDFQQLQIIRTLVRQMGLPVEIVGCPIVREPNGLAMSSRNGQLSDRLRKEASFIYKTLKGAKLKFGTKSAKYVEDWVQKQFKHHPYLKLEYVKIMNGNTLKPVVKKQKHQKYRAFVAVDAEGVRLIDNIALN